MFVSLRYGLERRDDALGVLALAAVFRARHVVVVPLEFHFVSFVELRDGRRMITFEVREALDCLLGVAVLAGLFIAL